MTEIERKALALVNEVERQEGLSDLTPRIMRGLVMDEALCRAIEQHEAFKREVSDAVEKLLAWPSIRSQGIIVDSVARFIIPKPDPLVEAVKEASNPDYDCASPEAYAEVLRAALAARGLKIVEDK